MADVVIGGVVVPEATIVGLRSLIGASELTDEDLASILLSTADADGTLNVDRAAAHVWRTKAANYAELVNVSESGSSRSLGDLQKNALSMAAQFDAKLAEVVAEGRRRSRTRAIVRPS